jgi:hypothetical protein
MNFNNLKNMFYIQFLDNKGQTHCGTYYQAIINLKTIKGLKNRLATYNRTDCTGYNVYKISDFSALYALDTDKQAPLLTVKY